VEKVARGDRNRQQRRLKPIKAGAKRRKSAVALMLGLVQRNVMRTAVMVRRES
jgi:hypothetical protein